MLQSLTGFIDIDTLHPRALYWSYIWLYLGGGCCKIKSVAWNKDQTLLNISKFSTL